MYGRYFEDFSVGKIYKHSITKTITESDNNLFCLLTLNHHPLHNDVCYAGGSEHGRIVVVGTYIVSLVVGMSVSDISGKAIANLDYEKIIHHLPVYIGDTIHAETEILEKRQSDTKHDRGIIYVETRAYNHWNEKVLTLRRHILIPRQPYFTFTFTPFEIEL
jgi:acyl dehydratase